MTTATQDPTKKSFAYDPEAFKQADQFAVDDGTGTTTNKSLFDEAAKASLSRLQKPGGVWNEDKFKEITSHYMKPLEQQAKQRTDALTAFFRARGWTDSGRDPAAQIKNLEMLNTDAAEKVYVPLTLEAMRNQDTTAQADIAQAANLGNQRLQAYLQGRGQQFQEYQGQAQLNQADQQIAIQARGMTVQERQADLQETNSAMDRAIAQGNATGSFVDPQTGLSQETLAKRQQIFSEALQTRQADQTDEQIAIQARGMSVQEKQLALQETNAAMDRAIAQGNATGTFTDPVTDTPYETLAKRQQIFNEALQTKQSEQTDEQIAIQARGMTVQERQAALQETNSAMDRAIAQGNATGSFIDPLTDTPYETLAKRQQIFNEALQTKQSEQTDEQIAIQARGMTVQERQAALQETNSAMDRAIAQGNATGSFIDPQTGLSQETLAKRQQIFNESAQARQLDQADKQIEIQVRSMGVQERAQLLAEANAAVTRAAAAADATGKYVDPVTGESYDTLAAKRDQLDRVIKLAEQTGYVPTDIARESGVPEGEVGGIKLGDYLTAEEIAALKAPAEPAAPAPPATELSAAQNSYLSQISVYQPTPAEQDQIRSLFLSGSPTAIQDIQAIVNGMYERARASQLGATDTGGWSAGQMTMWNNATSQTSFNEAEMTQLEQMVKANDLAGVTRLTQTAKGRAATEAAAQPQQPQPWSADQMSMWDNATAQGNLNDEELTQLEELVGARNVAGITRLTQAAKRRVATDAAGTTTTAGTTPPESPASPTYDAQQSAFWDRAVEAGLTEDEWPQFAQALDKRDWATAGRIMSLARARQPQAAGGGGQQQEGADTGGGVPEAVPLSGNGELQWNAEQNARWETAKGLSLTADEVPGIQEAIKRQDWATYDHIASLARQRAASGGGGQQQGGGTTGAGDQAGAGETTVATRGTQQWDLNAARNYARWSAAAEAGDEDAATNLQVMQRQMATDAPPDALLAQVGSEGRTQPQPPPQDNPEIRGWLDTFSTLDDSRIRYLTDAYTSRAAIEAGLADGSLMLFKGGATYPWSVMRKNGDEIARATAASAVVEPPAAPPPAPAPEPGQMNMSPPTRTTARMLDLTAAALGEWGPGSQMIRAALSRKYLGVQPEQWSNDVIADIFVGAS